MIFFCTQHAAKRNKGGARRKEQLPFQNAGEKSNVKKQQQFVNHLKVLLWD